MSAHNGYAAAALGDGKGRFGTIIDVSSGTIPTSEVHVAYDLNEDGKLDFEMTDGDGGGRWWMNNRRPARYPSSART